MSRDRPQGLSLLPITFWERSGAMSGLGVAIGRFWADDTGATAIEYGLIAGLIALSLIVAFTTLGSEVSGLFNYVVGTAGAAMDEAFG